MNTSADSLLSVVGLSKRFGTRSVLEDVHLSVGRSETVALIGPSGGGKSTLLRSINALNDWDAGEIRVGPYTLQAAMVARRDGAAVRQVRRLLGMVFQDFQLFPHFTAADNVAEAPRQVLRMARDAARAKAHELLERVGLAGHADHYPHQLSGGQKQRVAIARALAMQPHGLLCDEITSALDPELKHEVLDVVADLKRDGMALLLVTHEIGFARRAADRVVVLAEGRIIEEGPPSQVLDAPRHERTRQFLANVLV
ncbi:MAG TPA: amino acid ABC transporter ATP-binding protein [Pirellulales bacterium]|nr:amino acid ABC transporter ATP-binding protein [Pirellulales bacterium]